MEQELKPNEKTENTDKKLYLFQKGDDPRRNLDGRPLGALNFATKWRIFIDKVAKENAMTPEQVDEQLLAVGFKKAKEGDYNFYRDVHDRVYGRPKQDIDITSKGESIVNDVRIDELTKKLNDVYKGNGEPSDGGTANVVDTEVQNKE